ncbi:MAG: PilZ domain-containing protein [Blastocatellia bacterium]|nr:PilZ domain-containing protein [Blastocatellia bacterium]
MGEILRTGEPTGRRAGQEQSTVERSSAEQVCSAQISAYYLEIERLLDRVEHSATHYQALEVDQSATREDIHLAYKQAVSLLNPSRSGIAIVLPDDMQARTKQAFDRLSSAVAVLTNFGKRIEYDNSLRQKAKPRISVDIRMPLAPPLPKTVPIAPDGVPKTTGESANVSSDKSKITEDKQAAPPTVAQDAITIKHVPMQKEVYTKPVDREVEHDRRRTIRLKISLPARVTGHDRESGKWSETAYTTDVSRFGVALRMQRHVQFGMVLHLTLPLPIKLRSHGYSDPSYKVYAIVRRVEPPEDGVRLVGLEFLGERPPPGYIDTPWVTFRTRQWTGAERRREQRKAHSEPIRVKFLDESMSTVAEGEAMTENVSRRGIQIRLKAIPAEFDFVKVKKVRGRFEAVAVVRNEYAGKDGFRRLCLRFIDREWPL